MPFDIRHHGDPLERHRAELIESRLPGYARIWNAFIGNDGESRLPFISGLSKEEDSLRRLVSIRSYTALEAVVGAQRFVDQARALRVPSLLTEAGVAAYIDALNVLIGFFAQLGRVKDCMEKLGKEVHDPLIDGPLHEHYKQRNVILHDAKVPVWLADQLLAVAQPQGVDFDRSKWSSERTWEDADNLDYASLGDLTESIWSEMVSRLDSAFERLYSSHLHAKLANVAKALQDLSAPGTAAEGVTFSMPLMNRPGRLVSTAPSGSVTVHLHTLSEELLKNIKIEIVEPKKDPAV